LRIKAQLAAEANNLRELYQITKRLTEKPNTSQQAGVRDPTGRTLTTPPYQLIRRQEHFKENFATPPQQMSMNTTQMTPEIIKIPAEAPTKEEIKTAIKHLNPFTPNDPYSGLTAPLNSKRCILYIYSTNKCTAYFKHGLNSPFFSSKCSLFYNSNVFGSCIIHIFYTGCAKI